MSASPDESDARWPSSFEGQLLRRTSMLAMLVHTLIIPLSIILVLCIVALPIFWPLLALYALIMFLDSRSESGAPLNWFQRWCRRWWWWKAFAAYYPIRLHKTVDLAPSAPPVVGDTLMEHLSPWSWPDFPLFAPLWPLVTAVKFVGQLIGWRFVGWRILGSHKPTLPPSGNATKYLFGISPHGIISMGAFGAIATDGAGWSKLFPGVNVRLLTLASNFYFPFYRQYLLSTGIASVSKQSCINLLNNNQNICIVLGGAPESLLAEPGEFNLVLDRRFGFAKVALQTGAHLVPVLSFGENDIYEQVKFSPGSLGDKFHHWMTRYLGFTLPLFHARGIFNYDRGFMAYRRPINVVVGKPIEVPLTPNPSKELVQHYHSLYIAKLKELFAENVDKYSPGVELHIVG